MDAQTLLAKPNKTPSELEAARLIEIAAIREGLEEGKCRRREMIRRVKENNKAGRHPLPLEAAHAEAVDIGYRP